MILHGMMRYSQIFLLRSKNNLYICLSEYVLWVNQADKNLTVILDWKDTYRFQGWICEQGKQVEDFHRLIFQSPELPVEGLKEENISGVTATL